MELQEVSDFLEPNREIERNDHVVGEMSDDLKKLYTLWNSTMKSAMQLQMERMFGQVKDKDDWKARFDEITDKIEILQRLFWFAVKAEHNLWGYPSIGVRKGFTVVWSDTQESGPSDFLRRLLGGV